MRYLVFRPTLQRHIFHLLVDFYYNLLENINLFYKCDINVTQILHKYYIIQLNFFVIKIYLYKKGKNEKWL